MPFVICGNGSVSSASFNSELDDNEYLPPLPQDLKFHEFYEDHSDMLPHFESFCDLMQSRENILFYKDCLTYTDAHTPVKRELLATEIWEKYFKNEAELELVVESHEKGEIQRKIEQKDFQADLFQVVFEQVAMVLANQIFPLFLRSDLFEKLS